VLSSSNGCTFVPFLCNKFFCGRPFAPIPASISAPVLGALASDSKSSSSSYSSRSIFCGLFPTRLGTACFVAPYLPRLLTLAAVEGVSGSSSTSTIISEPSSTFPLTKNTASVHDNCLSTRRYHRQMPRPAETAMIPPTMAIMMPSLD